MLGEKYTKVDLENKLRTFVKNVTSVFNVDKIILFGSYAKGNPREYSDIDIALVSKDLDPKRARWENIEFVMQKANLEHDPDLQLIPFTKEAFENDKDSPIGSFIREIKKTGKVIYSNGK